MQPIAEQIEERVAPFLFANPAKAFASPLIRLEGAAAGYVADRPVLQDLDLRLDADDRIGLLGANGNGKSTFAKLIAGRMAPMAGRRYASDKIVVGYFAQHQMDDLPAGKTPYQHMLDLMPEATEAQRRARLGALGFGVDKADTKAENLSGGEKARLLFALATFHGAHLLILDEPTNHLDVDAREALVRALNDYEGAVILITHDRHLIEACADRLWIVRGGTVRAYDGDMDRYRAECLAERGATRRRGRQAKANGAAKPTPQEARRQAAELRAALAPLKKTVTKAEAEIERLSQQIATIERHSPTAASTPATPPAPRRSPASAASSPAPAAKPRPPGSPPARPTRPRRGRRRLGQAKRRPNTSRVPPVSGHPPAFAGVDPTYRMRNWIGRVRSKVAAADLVGRRAGAGLARFRTARASSSSADDPELRTTRAATRLPVRSIVNWTATSPWLLRARADVGIALEAVEVRDERLFPAGLGPGGGCAEAPGEGATAGGGSLASTRGGAMVRGAAAAWSALCCLGCPPCGFSSSGFLSVTGCGIGSTTSGSGAAARARRSASPSRPPPWSPWPPAASAWPLPSAGRARHRASRPA